MIVVDTSALMAILLDEPQADACSDILEREDEILLSAGTLAEALIVAARRRVGPAMARLIAALGCEVIPVTQRDAVMAAEAYARWGKGFHRAGLNYGDCFTYALASDRGCQLLFVGDDFRATDIPACIAPTVT